MAGNEIVDDGIEELLVDVLQKRSLAQQSQLYSTEASRLSSPRVFPSEHFRDVLGSILECGGDSCCLRPSERRLAVYSDQKLSRTGRTLYSAGEGRPCHEVIRPLTSIPNRPSSPSSPNHPLYGQRPPKNSLQVRKERKERKELNSTEEGFESDRKRRRNKSEHEQHRRPRHSDHRRSRLQGEHPDTFRIKRKNDRGESKARGHNDPSGDHDHQHNGRNPLLPRENKGKHDLLSTPGQNKDKNHLVTSGHQRTEKPQLEGPHHQSKHQKLPPVLSRIQQQKLVREAEEKRKRAEQNARKKKIASDRLKFPQIQDKKLRDALERHLWDANASGTDECEGEDCESKPKWPYEPCDDDEQAPEYSSWELATNLIKTPLKSLRGTIPPPEILLAYVRKRFSGEEWTSGCPIGRRFYPDGTTFVSTFANGSSAVFYPHGGLAIAISAPRPTHQVLVFRDPLEGFYFLDKSLLGGFNTLGIGVVYNNHGITQLRYDLDGGYQLVGSGQPHRWRWNGAGHRLLQKLNPFMSLRILGLDSIHLLFNGNKRGVRLNLGRGHVINLIAPNPQRLTRRPWWDADFTTGSGNPSAGATVRSQRQFALAESNSWECCTTVPYCCPCLETCSPCTYCN